MALVTLQTIFQDAFPTYEQMHPLPTYVRRAVRAIMQCRTAALGGHVQACPDGHMSRVWYNSCRHRACPQCAYLQTERWLALQRARLLACDHYHVIFTLPHELNPLWLANVPVMTTLLFQAARDTLAALLGDPKYLGAQPGIIAALHTWSQTLVLHPHVHCLVTGGGLTTTGSWVAVRNGFLLPARVVMAVFRGKMVAAIRQTFARGAAVAQSPEPSGPPDEDEVECADHGALSPRGGRRDVSGPLPAGWSHQERALGGLGWGRHHLHVSRAWGSPPAADDVARGGLSAAVAPPCPGAPDARGAVLWPVSSDARRGPRRLPHGAWATADGDAGAPDLAAGVCPAWGGPSRAVSHLRAAARVHRRDPARGCATACPGWGARSMSPAHDRLLGEVGQGGGVSGGGPVVALRGQGRGLGGSQSQVCGLLPHSRGGQGLWEAGWRGGAAAQTP